MKIHERYDWCKINPVKIFVRFEVSQAVLLFIYHSLGDFDTFSFLFCGCSEKCQLKQKRFSCLSFFIIRKNSKKNQGKSKIRALSCIVRTRKQLKMYVSFFHRCLIH